MRTTERLFAPMASALVFGLGVGAASMALAGTDDEVAGPAASTAAKPATPKGGKPGALREHLNKLKQAMPANADAISGPGSAGDGGFIARAYPNDDIPLSSIEAARAAAQKVVGRPFPTGKGRPGTFVTVGPSDALYPKTPFRPRTATFPTTIWPAAARLPLPSNLTARSGIAGSGSRLRAVASGARRTR